MQNCHYIILYLLIIRLKVYKRTTARFIADDKVVYQVVRRATRLASDNSWARVVWSIWAADHDHVCTRKRGMPVSIEISRTDRCVLTCSADWARGPSPSQCCHTRRTRSAATWLPENYIPVLWLFFSRLSIFPRFQHLSGNSRNSLRAPYRFDR